MALTAMVDNPVQFMYFCRSWGITNPATMPMRVTCAGCAGTTDLALVADTRIPDTDAKALLIIELLSRRWHLDEKGRPFCPNCR